MKREIYETLYRKDVENLKKHNSKAEAMFTELTSYLLKKKRGIIFYLKKVAPFAAHDPVSILYNHLFLDNSTYLCKFYEVAKKYNYSLKTDALNAISILTSSDDVEKDIKRLKQVPLINDIKYDDANDLFLMDTSFNAFTFRSAKKAYPLETQNMEEIARKENKELYDFSGLDYLCHLTAKTFIKIHPECYFVTCKCPNIFEDTWWLHSYILTEDESTVIDFANNTIISKNDFEMLIEPTVLLKLKGTSMDNLEEIVQKLDIPRDLGISDPLTLLVMEGEARLKEGKSYVKY